jgi:signal peptidase I
MVTTGFCESCGGRVALSDDYSCVNDHLASQVHDIQGSEIPEPTWAVGSDGKGPRRRVARSTVVLVGGLVVAAMLLGISAAAVMAEESALRATASRPSVVSSAPVGPPGVVSAAPASVQTSIAPHRDKAVDKTSAMAPTIVSGQHYKLHKGAYGAKVGDIVYFRGKNGSRLIRRVVGLSGDAMSLGEGWVYRNAEGPNEPYVKYNDERLTVGAVLVPKGAVFVIGDNRDRLSSEFWGVVTRAEIQGFVTP